MFRATANLACVVFLSSLVIFTAAGVGGCNRGHSVAAEKSPEERKTLHQAAIKQQVLQLAEKHHAKADWITPPTDQRFRETYAFEVQEAFDPLIGQPIVFTGDVFDIYRTNRGYRLLFCMDTDAWGSACRTEIWNHTYFILDLTAEDARQIRDNDAFVIGCKATVVAIPERLDLRFDNVLHDQNPDDDLSGEYELVRKIWIVGKLVEAVPVPKGS